MLSVTLCALMFLHAWYAVFVLLNTWFLHAFGIDELLCVNGFYVITNELLLRNTAERGTLWPAENF